MKIKIGISIVVCLALFTLSCHNEKIHLDPKTMSDKQLYDIGVKYLNDGDYDKSREAFKTVYENFPKSEYRIIARIGYADSYYKEGRDANWTLAVQEYQDFINLFPFSPKAQYAQFQIGLCYYNMMEKPDRDQTQTKKAVDEFKKVLDNYPNGDYYQKGYQYLLKCYSSLAEHEFQIARYYERTGRPLASVERIKALLKSYPEAVHQPKYIYTLAKALQQLKQYPESCTYYDQFLKKWPTADHSADAKEAQTKYCKEPNRAAQ